MGFSSEIRAALGIDTSSIPGDMSKARAAFNQGANQLQADAGKHGAGAGDQFVGSLEHRLLGARHLSGALATALGLNLENISNHIAAAIVGGSKEAWEQAVKLADENTAIIQKLIETRLSPKQLGDKQQNDLQRALAEQSGAGKDGPLNWFQKLVAKYGGAGDKQIAGLKSDADKEIEQQAAQKKVLEAQLVIEEHQKQVREATKALDQARAEASEKNLTGKRAEEAINNRINGILKEITSGNLSDLEIIAKKKQLIEEQGKLEAAQLRTKEQAIEKERTLARLALDLQEAQRKMNADQEEAANHRADRGRTTLGELAELSANQPAAKARAYKFGEDSGLSDEARAAKATAREIEDMQAQAERLRRSGDVNGANELFDQIGAKKDTLVKSGFLKSSEGDDMRKFTETLHKDQVDVIKILNETKTVLDGKFVNQ